MAGPIGFGVGSARGVKRVVCPRCGAAMARSKQVVGTVSCKTCKHRFDVPAKTDAKTDATTHAKKR